MLAGVMKLKIVIVLIVFSLSTVVVQSALRAQPAQQPTKSVLDGVFNEEQLKRGTQTFIDNCSVCHGQDLSGGEIAPALFGPNFMANWNGLTVGDLFERIRISMPPDNPDKMSSTAGHRHRLRDPQCQRLPHGQNRVGVQDGSLEADQDRTEEVR